MNLILIDFILFHVKYRDWQFRSGVMGDGFYIRISFVAHKDRQYGRKWYISSHAVEGEVVQTAFLAIKTALEHELREEFLYYDQAIFGPHFTPAALLEMTRKKDSEVKR